MTTGHPSTLVDPTKNKIAWWYDWVFLEEGLGFGFRFSAEGFAALCEIFAQRTVTPPGFLLPSCTEPWGVGASLTPRVQPDGSVDILMRVKDYRQGSAPKSLAALTSFFTRYSLLPRDDAREQLLILEGVCAQEELGGGSIGLTLTPTLANWLRDQRDNQDLWDALCYTMFQSMHPDWPAIRVRAEVEETGQGAVRLLRPSNQLVIEMSIHMSIGPSPYASGPNRLGYEMASNNFDNWFCQPPFLRTLAHLHTLAREAGL